MLTKRHTIEAKCAVDGVEIAGFRAVFDSENPESMAFHHWQIDKAACKEHRATVRAEQAEFEDYAYRTHEEILNKNM